MPCDKLAVVQARLKLDTSLLLDPPVNVQEGIRTAVALAMGIESGRVQISSYGTLTISAAGITFRLDGMGITAETTRDLSRRALDALAAKVGESLNKLTGLILQQKVKQALRMRYRTASETRAPNGAIVLEMEI